MPPRKSLGVALYAASPRAGYRPVGFPLQSLTRNAILLLVSVLGIGCSNKTTMENISRNEDAEKAELTYKPVGGIYSGHQLRIISIDPAFQPSPESQEQVLSRLIAHYDKSEISSTLYKDVQFVDPGQNFETVTCNNCKQEIDMQAWQEMMSTAHEKHFADLSIVTHCCGKPSTLNELVYQSPAGFARYILTVIDPSKEIEAEVLSDLEQTLGTKLKLIYANV